MKSGGTCVHSLPIYYTASMVIVALLCWRHQKKFSNPPRGLYAHQELKHQPTLSYVGAVILAPIVLAWVIVHTLYIYTKKVIR